MSHGANRTLVGGKLGIVSVYVDCLDNASEGDEQDTQQRQSSNGLVFAQLVPRWNQAERLVSMLTQSGAKSTYTTI
jgi:hypothetical protein